MLATRITEAKADTTRARLSGILAWELRFTNPTKALELANQEIRLAKKLNNYTLLADGYRVKALTLVITENILEGMSCYDSALVYARKAGNLVMEASCYSLMAGMYGDHADYDKAIEFYTKGYRIAVKSKNKSSIATLSNNLAEVYQLTGRNTTLAQHYFSIALAHSLEINDTENAGMNSANLAYEYALNGEPKKAISELKRSVELMQKKRKDLYRYATTCHVIASTYLKMHNNREAEKFALVSASIMDSLKRADNLLRPLSVLTSIYVSDKNMTKARLFAQQLLQNGTEQNAKLYIRDAYKALADISYDEGKYKEAFMYYEQYKTWNDSVFKAEREKTVAAVELESALAQKELEIRFKTEKKNTENINLRKQNDLLRTGQLIVIIACIVFIVLVILLYNAYRRKNKINAALAIEKKIVEQYAIEKGMLVHEIHHRVKNNLTMLKSLLFLQAKTATQAETKRILEECQARILSMSLVHQNLYEENDKGRIDFTVFLEGMFNEVSASFLPGDKNIDFEVQGERTEFNLLQGIPVALIINELVTNSLKYAFLNSNEGKILVEISQQNNFSIIRYLDSGPGLANGFDFGKGGFGFKLMGILTNQLNAKMWYEKSNTLSVFTLEIPI